MSDNKKWFKVWATILNDPHHSNLSVKDVGRWTRLGALMVSQGNNGRLQIIPPAKTLCILMECGDFTALIEVLKVLPNVQIDPPENDNGEITVSFYKWFKYQMDSTGYERVKRSRYKRREDKIRSTSTSYLTSPRATLPPAGAGGATRETAGPPKAPPEIDYEKMEQQEANRAWKQNMPKTLPESERMSPEEMRAIRIKNLGR